MTRHERRGALALLALIVALIVAVWLVRTRTVEPTLDQQRQMRQFELMTDSLQQRADSAGKAAPKHRKPKKDSHKAKAKGKPKGKSRSGSTPQRLDPVPTF